METRNDFEQKRQEIVREMLAITAMRRGTINEQYFKVNQKGKSEPMLRGPYFVFSRREGSRTVSERLTSPQQLDQARQDISAYKKFQDLCKEFAELTEQMCALERQKTPFKEKKRWNSPSKPTVK